MPGAFTVPAADHGGAMTNGVTHPGRIEIGDLDMWSFAACLGASVAVTINEVPVGPGTPDPGFWPWIRLYNSAGALASNGSAYGDTLAQINAHGDAAGHIHPRGQHGRFRLRRHRRLHRQGAGGRGLVPKPDDGPRQLHDRGQHRTERRRTRRARQ